MAAVVITGGYGFIGSNTVNYFCERGYDVILVDKRTYAADPKKVKYVIPDKRVYIMDVGLVQWVKLLREHNVKCVINFAAESHVDNSITDGGEFMNSNCVAVQRLLAQLNAYYETYNEKIYLLHISTDEVYGDISFTSPYTFSEQDVLRPNNPYSATKAATDLLIQAYHHTYQSFDYNILRACNNFGPGQYKEKFLPTIIRNVMVGKKVPVYGEGKNVREWLYVEDFARVIDLFVQRWLERQAPSGEVFNVASGYSLDNLSLVRKVLGLMGVRKSEQNDHIEFVADRKGHDRRYAINSWKLQHCFGISFAYSDTVFGELLLRTIADVKARYTA